MPDKGTDREDSKAKKLGELLLANLRANLANPEAYEEARWEQDRKTKPIGKPHGQSSKEAKPKAVPPEEKEAEEPAKPEETSKSEFLYIDAEKADASLQAITVTVHGKHGDYQAVRHKRSGEQVTMRDLYARMKRDGGFTFDVANKRFIQRGYAVSVHKGHETKYKAPSFSKKDLAKYLNEKRAMIAANPGAMLGAWYDPNTDDWYLDISHVVEDKEEALRLAEKHDQEAIFDLGEGETVYVKKTKSET